MSKTPSKKLYQLIHSLSGSEKRYFKLFVQKNGVDTNNKYIQLFDAIDKQRVFDEDALQQHIYKGSPIQSRKYSELKAYLYDLILKALQNYDEKTSIDYRLKGMLQNIRVLYKRGHYDDCKESIQKAKKMAHKYEDFTTLLQLLNWEKQIAYTLINVRFFDEELGRIDREEKECLQRLQNLSAYRNIFLQLYSILRKVAFTSRAEIKTQLQTLVDSPLLQDEKAPQSHLAKVFYYRITSLYHYARGAYDDFYQHSKTLIELMESQGHYLKEDVSEYISAISNHTVSCRRLHLYEEWKQTNEKLLQIIPKTYDDKLKIHRQYYQGKFSWCITTGAFEEGVEALDKHLKDVQQFDQALFTRGTFYFQYFQLYFGNENYDQALEYLNRWLNQPKSLERQDLQTLARLLNLIIHYEMGNTILLESLLRSTYRYLKKVDQLRPIERKILNFIKNSTKVYSQKEMQAYYISLQNDLDNLSETGKMGPFDLAAWLDSKINKKPFAQVVQEKFKNRESI